VFIPVVLVGLADDGPAGTLVKPGSFIEAQEIFGWWTNEIHTVPASGTSITLGHAASSSDWYVFQVLNGALYKTPLYDPSISGSTLSFGAPGASGTYLVQYTREQDEGALLLGLSTYLQTGATMPYVWRVSGTKATLEVDGLVFSARYCGTRYNGIGIQFDGTTLTVTVPNSPKNSTVSYTVDPPSDFLTQFNYESGKGKHPVELLLPNSDSFPLSVGSWVLTGGVDGTLDTSTVVELLEALDLGSIGLIVLCGGHASGVIDAAVSYIEEQDSTTCLVAGAPIAYKSAETADYLAYLQALPFSSNQLFYTTGWGVQTLPGGSYTYWDNLSTAFAGVWDKVRGSPIHKRTYLLDTLPKWSESELASLNPRFVTATRFIQTGIGFLRALTTGGRSPMVTQVLFDITSRLYNVLGSYLGEPSVDIGAVEVLVSKALSGVANVRSLTYDCYLDQYSITIKITVVVVGEVQEITFDVVTNR